VVRFRSNRTAGMGGAIVILAIAGVAYWAGSPDHIEPLTAGEQALLNELRADANTSYRTATLDEVRRRDYGWPDSSDRVIEYIIIPHERSEQDVKRTLQRAALDHVRARRTVAVAIHAYRLLNAGGSTVRAVGSVTYLSGSKWKNPGLPGEPRNFVFEWAPPD